ncbi:hypothetical protein GCM10022206_89240 [Streptomyces chiangmaiensis]
MAATQNGMGMTTSDVLLLTHADRRLYLVPVHALRSVVLFVTGGDDPDRTTVACRALPSGQVVHVNREEIRPHLLPDDAVSAVLISTVRGDRAAASRQPHAGRGPAHSADVRESGRSHLAVAFARRTVRQRVRILLH